MLNVIINGALGKMGKVLIDAVNSDEELNLAAAVDKGAQAMSEKPASIYGSIFDVNVKADVVIDFSRPEAAKDLIKYCKDNKCALVLATTGFSDEELDFIHESAKEIPIFNSYNMSLGVNLMLSLVAKAAQALEGFDIEIIEKHHNEKVDAPSGTAIMIANEINDALDNTMQMNYGRYGRDCKRSKNEIGIHAVRGGTIVGDHTAVFAGKDEIIEIRHTANSKQIFAQGALRAAKFISGKGSGFYNMKDLFSF